MIRTFSKSKTALALAFCLILIITETNNLKGSVVLINDDFSTSGTLRTGDFNRVRTRYAIDPGDSGDWVKGAAAWSLTNGSIQNSSSNNGSTGEAGIGIAIDVSSITSNQVNNLKMSFDYELGDASESLFLHLWGVIQQPGTLNETSTGQGANDMIAHIGFRQDGRFEDFSFQVGSGLSDVLDMHNLLNGTTAVGRPDIRSQDAIELTGTTGAQTYSNEFDISGQANNSLAAYDYLVVGFSRNVAGTNSSVSFDNFSLIATPEPSAAMLFLLGIVPAVRRRKS